MIYKYAGQLRSDAFERRTAATEESTPPDSALKYFSVSDFSRIAWIVLIYKCIHFPVSRTAADIFHEVVDHLRSLCRVEALPDGTGSHTDFSSAFSAAATGQSAVCALISNPEPPVRYNQNDSSSRSWIRIHFQISLTRLLQSTLPSFHTLGQRCFFLLRPAHATSAERHSTVPAPESQFKTIPLYTSENPARNSCSVPCQMIPFGFISLIFSISILYE